MKRSIDSSFNKGNSPPKGKVMNLKTQLKLYLELRDITAAELSRRTGISKQVISLWLSGAEPKKISHLRKIADCLQTTIDHLCFGNGKDVESQRITELDALMGDSWVSGVFEVKMRRVRRNSGDK